MTSFYGSTTAKLWGINMQPEIAKKVKKLFQSWGYNVTITKSSFHQDTKQKFDYIIEFDQSTPFKSKDGTKVFEHMTIDVKYAKSFTLFDQNGNNTLENSKSNFIVYQIPGKDNELLWINTNKLKTCLKMNKPIMRVSEEEGNKSKYFFIEQYLNDNKDYMKKYFKTYKIV